MKLAQPDLVARLGADRVLEPRGALPQPAERLDPKGPVRARELEIAVSRLCLDSTSHRNLAAQDMAGRIREIVAARGKMHNPETDSGGVLVGTVSAIGADYADAPALGTAIVSLASLTLTPLTLHRIVRVDPASPQVDVEGVAYLPERAPWGPVPGDIDLATALAIYDVYGAASHTRNLAPGADTICVLGTGHAGKVALAAARDAAPGATLVAVDVEPAAVERVRDLCDVGVVTDLRDPVAAVAAVRAAGAGPADLTVNVVNATGCEPAAILLTADKGTVLLYSMATSFQTAALTADGMSADVTLFIGNGFAPDRGAYALDLARTNPALRAAL